MDAPNNILIAPLNWGLGHATRCIPILLHQLDLGNNLFIAADGDAYNYFSQYIAHELPRGNKVHLLRLPDLHIRYSSSSSQLLAMVRQFPAIVRNAFQEHRLLKQLVQQYHIHTVISDNRFGLWCSTAHCVYITHQLMIKCPRHFHWAEPLLHKIHLWIIRHYDECWVPDYESPIDNLSGDLSHRYTLPSNARFIGILSRFSSLPDNPQAASTSSADTTFHTIAIVSGPEPQRSLFEQELRLRLCREPHSFLILNGTTSTLPINKMRQAIVNAQRIICRSGYSTIMDLDALGCLSKAELIPTPGQTEQEYLAIHLAHRSAK